MKNGLKECLATVKAIDFDQEEMVLETLKDFHD